jgi:AbrB family looped-hinge helix DNA binding protein
MRATGIVRRIDDLGRVVIPKEIRRNLRIREGDPLELYTSREGEIIFKKYSPIGEAEPTAKAILDTLKTFNIHGAIYDNSGYSVYTTDRNMPNDFEYDEFNPNTYSIKVDGDFWGHLTVNRTLTKEEASLITALLTMFAKLNTAV